MIFHGRSLPFRAGSDQVPKVWNKGFVNFVLSA
jgi:hypothetical protein